MQSHGDVYGIDISSKHLELASYNLPGIPLVLGDAHNLPYTTAVFDISLCHFLILWATDPVRVVSEMARVTQLGGPVLALAEPDYGGRIDFPPELKVLGDWQQAALRQQGADPLLGRRLRAIFQQAGLTDVEAGVLGGQWSGIPSSEDWEIEWKVLEEDIQQIPWFVESSDVTRLRRMDQSAWEHGERILFVPTFYALGRVPVEGKTAGMVLAATNHDSGMIYGW
jgi:SAM-dependent methyltransferase